MLTVNKLTANPIAMNIPTNRIAKVLITNQERGWVHPRSTWKLTPAEIIDQKLRHAEWLKQRATNDEIGYVREAAVKELARDWWDDPDTLPILKQRATNDEDGNVRLAAVQELARVHGAAGTKAISLQ
jgi:hypothetical protein